MTGRVTDPATGHGGQLNAAVRRWGIAREDWLDLSAGITPWPWPVPPVPPEIWQRLPEEDDGLATLAAHWAGAPATAGCVPVAGSQGVIAALPGLREACAGSARVGVITPGYSEHSESWAAAGHEVVPLSSVAQVTAALPQLQVLVWINPNNPTGEIVSRRQLLQWHRALAARGGWLIVDEAFLDASPAQSLAPDCGPDGLLVLRSLGKFFGLAGARTGLVCGPPALCTALSQRLGLWAVSGPARFAMREALADQAWQAQARSRLAAAAQALQALLRRHGLVPSGSCDLFCYCPHPDALRLADGLARQGILVRCFADPSALRFALPADAAAMARLDAALHTALLHVSDSTA
ncbi:MAG: threonine-phosphate decarboxylase CobD [Alcanivorax sp.]|nr:threonine-phosphate decarboxylase CobD [Alcanivorax sp.]